MSLNSTPSSERVHIGFFGLRNAGKSSIVNAVTEQKVSVVSDIKGTTTDPIRKAMELLPIGPVLIIDTPGTDDSGTLGKMRVERTLAVLNETDIAVLVVDALRGMSKYDSELTELFKEKKIPYLTVFNKVDLLEKVPNEDENTIFASAETGDGIRELKVRIGKLANVSEHKKPIVSDIVGAGSTVILVTPIDSAAPKGRIILPQQQVLRDLLDCGAVTVVVRETELEAALNTMNKKPDLVITDSQVFGLVDKIVPREVLLTSFSVLFARYKGSLADAVKGAAVLKRLTNGECILIAEGCTHHRQCGDIGTVKLPAWINEYTKKDLRYEFCSGHDFPEDLSRYSLIIHCGACTLNEREMQSRIGAAKSAGVPITNYGTVIAEVHGILKRSVSLFPDIASET